MKNSIITFDTNALRDICSESSDVEQYLQTYYDKLNKLHITVFANPYVVMELIAHLTPNDLSFNECRNGLKATFQLARTNEGQLRILCDFESLLVKALYGFNLPKCQQIMENLSQAVKLIHDNTPGKLPNNLVSLVTKISDHIDSIENQFVADMHKYVVKAFNPAEQGWEPLKKDETLRNRVLQKVT